VERERQSLLSILILFFFLREYFLFSFNLVLVPWRLIMMFGGGLFCTPHGHFIANAHFSDFVGY